MIRPRHSNLLAEDPRPLFFPVANAEALGLAPPPDRHGASLRTWARTLAGMQKEAVVVNGATGRAWRLVSDEGPYLAGWDVGPCPLAFLTTGMVASYIAEILALADQRGRVLPDLRLTLDNRYSMQGSLLQGTMVGGALAPELHVEVDAPGGVDAVRRLVIEAIDASPINGLLRGSHTSRFTLAHNGRRIEVGRVADLDAPVPGDPGDALREIIAASARAEPVVRKVAEAERVEGVAHGSGSSLQDSQSRQLHVRGVCTRRTDGVSEIRQSLFKPFGSSFTFLADDAPGTAGNRAPDAATYLSAGIGFCFMTQFGRYAEITKKPIDGHCIVQDTHFSLGGATGRTGVAGRADPVETHVFLTTGHDDDFARTVLDMAEQTCFLHAFCRTDLKTRLRLGGRPASAYAAEALHG